MTSFRPAIVLRAVHRARGVTMVELVMSLTILSILMLAMNGVVLLTAKAVPDGRSKASSIVVSSRATEQVAGDIRFATTVLSNSATSLELALPDMDGNGMADRVKYSWTGVAGDPLLRQYARGDTATSTWTYGAAVAVAANVQEFALAYDKRRVLAAQTYTTSAEQLLSSSNAASSLNFQRINSSNWVGQYFKPTLPSNATAWAVTRVMLQARIHGGSAGQSLIQICPANSSGLPTAQVVDQFTLNESTLTASFAYTTATYTNAVGLDPAIGACVVVKWVSDADSCDIQFQQGLSGLVNPRMVQTTNGGSTWSSVLTQSLNSYIYGTVTTADSPTYSYFLTGVRMVLRTTTDPNARVYTTARSMNEPQVSGP